MAFDSTTVFTAQALPTPIVTPRQTLPSRASPRRTSSSPPSMPNDEESRHEEQEERQGEGGTEEISPFDPRRFTPNLHASLVSQILSLQREVENKNKTVNNLEELLHITKTENERLSNTTKDQAKENRAIKKQAQVFESTTMTALGDIAKERDEANENLAEARKRLESSKSRVRSQEEGADEVQIRWDKERQNWDMEKRNMETKVHLVEGRLKAVLGEIAAAQANGNDYPRTSVDFDESMHGTWYNKESDSTSSRSDSVKRRWRFSGQSNTTNEVSEYLNYRASTLDGLNGFGGNKTNGISLADELDLSADEHDQEGNGTDSMISPDALPEEAQFHRRRPSTQSISQDQKAWKVLGLLPENFKQTIKEEGSTEKTAAKVVDSEVLREKAVLEKEDDASTPTNIAAVYIDSATQCSPPISPILPPQLDIFPLEKVADKVPLIERTANQSRKRASAPIVEQMMPPKPGSPPVSSMVSAGCQTVNQPPSPPLTPVIAIDPPASASIPSDAVVQMISSSMQTDDDQQTALAAVDTRGKRSSITVPVIEIHPPGSRPPSSHDGVVLPPRTKNAGCQASLELPVSMRSVSVQTEAVISGKLPIDPHSRSMPKAPSQSSLSQSGLARIEERSPGPPEPAQRKNSRKDLHRPPATEKARPRIQPSFSAPVLETYPGSNDSGPLTRQKPTGLRRPVRSGSLFAGFDSAFTDDTFKLKDFDLSSDDDAATVAPIRKTLSKVQNSWKLVPHSPDDFMGRLESVKNSMDNLDVDESSDPRLAGLVPLGPQATKDPSREDAGRKGQAVPKVQEQSSMRGIGPSTSAPGPRVRRGTTDSAPSVPEKDSAAVGPPPFPVPTRSSSRRIPISVSEGAQSPTPNSTTFFSTARKRGVRNPSVKNPLRKVRSAAAVPRFGRSIATPPQPLSPSTLAFHSPQLPRMPKNDITSRSKNDPQSTQPTTHALPPASLDGEAQLDTPGQSTSVVDAIAQTMVGEWMWKYVRRRKSFGITDDVDFDENGNANGNGIRHKRWVWLAPYERAVMWSSKQPTSGPALMGKNGRKLNIQSVLDVKDDAPIPKNSNPQACFGRSILILTPQRALKFTATTRDRHYVWLTALSFLSHSPAGMDDLATVPPLPPAELQRPPSRPVSAGLRRSSIRDSIRVAKSKDRPTMGAHAFSPPITALSHEAIEGVGMSHLADDPDTDAAEAPSIPRTAAHTRTHTRKRSSSSGPRPGPPKTFNSFSANTAAPPSRTLGSFSAQDYAAFPPRGPGASASASAQGRPSQPMHDPLPTLDPIRNNFFDAVGTVRMEAFVEENEKRSKRASKKPPPLGNSWVKNPGKKDLRYWGVGGESPAASSGRANKSLEDPFGGFSKKSETRRGVA